MCGTFVGKERKAAAEQIWKRPAQILAQEERVHPSALHDWLREAITTVMGASRYLFSRLPRAAVLLVVLGWWFWQASCTKQPKEQQQQQAGTARNPRGSVQPQREVVADALWSMRRRFFQYAS